MSKSIYEEAIADAKKVREAAEANAKNAILESVTPKIREFIEQTILEQEEKPEDKEKDEDEKDEDEKDKKGKDTTSDATIKEAVTLDESAISTLLNLLGGEDALSELSSSNAQSAVSSVVNEAIENLTDDEREKLFNLADNLERNIDILESKEINNHVSQKENNDMAQETFYEVDLKSLQSAINEAGHAGAKASMEELDDQSLEELMMMMEDEHEGEGGEGGGDDLPKDLFADIPPGGEEVEVDTETEVEVEGDDLPSEIQDKIDELEDAIADILASAKGDVADAEADLGAAEADLGGGEEVEVAAEEETDVEALEEVFEIDPRMLRREINKIRQELREGKHDMEHHFGGKGHANVGTDKAYGGKGTGKTSYKNSFGGGKEGKDPFTNPPQMNKLSEALRKQIRENRELNEKLGKYRSAVKSLREQLEDLNLFNAKLLYVNKLLQNKSLTESQRKSVIRALDRAGSLNEAKTLYNSLTESFSSKGKTLNESARRGSSSRTTTSATSKQGNGEVNRWAKLAGLK